MFDIVELFTKVDELAPIWGFLTIVYYIIIAMIPIAFFHRLLVGFKVKHEHIVKVKEEIKISIQKQNLNNGTRERYSKPIK